MGGAIMVGTDMVAYTVAERFSADTLVIHFEKGNHDFKGIYQAINQMFLENAGQEFAVVNREQDLDSEGLRKAKLSYNPVGVSKKVRCGIVCKHLIFVFAGINTLYRRCLSSTQLAEAGQKTEECPAIAICSKLARRCRTDCIQVREGISLNQARCQGVVRSVCSLSASIVGAALNLILEGFDHLLQHFRIEVFD